MDNKLNSGAFFLNDKKQNEKQPDFTGTANINGKEMRVSIWQRISQGGRQYWSMAFSDLQPQQQTAAPAQAMPRAAMPIPPAYTQQAQEAPVNDDLPF